jgi:hypothetical protein
MLYGGRDRVRRPTRTVVAATRPDVRQHLHPAAPAGVGRVVIRRAGRKAQLMPISNAKGPAADLCQFGSVPCGALIAPRASEGLQPVLDRHPPVRTIQNVFGAQLHPWHGEATRLLVPDVTRRQHLDDRGWLHSAVEHDVGDQPSRETNLRRGVRDVAGNVLDDATLAAVARAGPRNAGTRAAACLPLSHDPEELGFGSTVERALTGATLAATVSEMRTTDLAAAKHDVRAAAWAAVRPSRHRVLRPDERAVVGEGYRNCNFGVRHG